MPLPTLCIFAKLLQSCPTVCNPMDSSPPGSSVHGILQESILEWAVYSYPFLNAKAERLWFRSIEMETEMKPPQNRRIICIVELSMF